MDKSNIKITILGAGISGLAAAYWLQKAGWDITVLEAAREPGGSMITQREEGFLIDYGANSGLDTTPLISQMVAELDFLEPQGKGCLGLGHAWRHGGGNDLLHVAQVVATVGEPGMDDVDLAHVFHPHRPVGFPGLQHGPFTRDPTPHRGAAIAAVHRAGLNHRVLVSPRRDFLDMRSGPVGRLCIGRPGVQAIIRARGGRDGGQH